MCENSNREDVTDLLYSSDNNLYYLSDIINTELLKY